MKIARYQPKPASWFGNGNKNGLVTHTIAQRCRPIYKITLEFVLRTVAI